MTASAVTSSAEASTSASVHSTEKPVSSANNTNSSWTQPFFHDFEPTLLPSTNTGTYSFVGNSPELARSSSPSSSSSSSTALLSFPPLFSSWSHQPHSAVHFLRGNGVPFGSSNNAIGQAYSSNRSRTSSEQAVTIPTPGSSLSSASSSSSGPRNVVPAAAIELSSASAAAASQTISLHPSGKTTPPVATTTPTILTTSKRPVIIIYPTVSPESIVIPIVSCIFGFPILALMVICCLRRRAKLARERDRRRNYDMQDHAVSLVRFSPIHRLNNRSSRAISLRPERSLSRGFPSLELDTVIEERSDPEQTQTDLLSPESPLDPQRFHEFNSS